MADLKGERETGENKKAMTRKRTAKDTHLRSHFDGYLGGVIVACQDVKEKKEEEKEKRKRRSKLS